MEGGECCLELDESPCHAKKDDVPGSMGGVHSPGAGRDGGFVVLWGAFFDSKEQRKLHSR